MSLISTSLLSVIFSLCMQQTKPFTMLCLGDSYTIGQSVQNYERFPEQALKLLKEKNILFDTPTIIAKTGWSTQSLLHAIEQEHIQQSFDYVTLLTGVNDQYQEVEIEAYKIKFEEVLNTAINYANGNAGHVIVLSIPDYGVTPFAAYEDKSPEAISKEIDNFNAANKAISAQYKVHYIDINPLSKKAKTDSSLLAADSLHPSAKMYAEWAALLAAEIELQIKNN